MNASTTARAPLPPQPSFYGAPERGLRSWLLTKDHKRIGVMFIVATTAMLGLGGVYALLLRIKLLSPGPFFVDATTYNRFFSAHGIIMVFLFMIPAIPAGFGNFLVPLMLGARDVAFPRLNLASLYLYLAGCVLVLFGVFWGGIDTGWTFYVPYSLKALRATVPVLAGLVVVGFSSIATGLNFIVTTHTLRARGMRWTQLPLFVWSIYATSIIQVLATPVLGMSLLLVGADRLFHLGVFDPAMGGDPVLFQHLFWFYSHPAVYIMVLPAMAVVSETVCVHSRKNPASYKAIAFSSLGIAFVGFLTWGHHMFVAGISRFDAGVFGVLSMFVAIFSAIKVFTWTLTMQKGSVAFNAPIIYFLSFLFLFVFGGMTGVAVASTALDVHWHDTYFVVAHFHFIMVGGTLVGWLAAAHHWFPKITGRMYDERWARPGAAAVFLGFFFTFFPQFLLGNAGMPRRYWLYPPEYQMLHVVSTAGASILAAGLVIVLVNLLYALWRGRPAGDDPWPAHTLEWKTSSPPPPHNFSDEPVEVAPDYEPYGFWRKEQQDASRS